MADAQILGPYRLERVLGTGSFATVWLAHDQVLDRRVAVKILADNWSRDHEVRRRFLSEASFLLSAESTRIVRGFHLGETATGQPYLVMAWADRGTLGDRLEQRRREGRHFDPMETVSISAEIAFALVDVHTAGHLHRDVKPTNVLLRSSSTRRDIPGLAGDETIVLADFGLARGLDLTSLTLVAGSPGYVSPEQAAGLTQLDRRADLYSLGRIMLELLTGDPGGSATTMAAAANERVDVPAAIDDAVERGATRPPAALVELISRLVAPEPDDRPSTADEVAAALVALKASMSVPGVGGKGRALAPPTPAPPPELDANGLPNPTGTQLAAPPPPSRRISGRTMTIAGAGLAAVVALVVALVALRGDGGGGTSDDTTPAMSAAGPAVPVTAGDGSTTPPTEPATTSPSGTATTSPSGLVTSAPVDETTSPDSDGPVPPADAARLDLSSMVPDFDAELDEGRDEAAFVGPVADALDALLDDNPDWELAGEAPAADAHEPVTVTLVGPDGEVTVRLSPKAETATPEGVALTDVVVVYD